MDLFDFLQSFGSGENLLTLDFLWRQNNRRLRD